MKIKFLLKWLYKPVFSGKKFSDEIVKDVLFSSLVHVNTYQPEKMIYFKYILPSKGIYF